MALIDIETGEAIVNAVFDDDQRAMKTSTQLGSWRSNKNFLTAKQVRRVRMRNYIRMIYIGRVRQEDLIEQDSDSEESNQDGLDLEESDKEHKAIGAFGDVESQGPREAFFSAVLKAQNDDTNEDEV